MNFFSPQLIRSESPLLHKGAILEPNPYGEKKQQVPCIPHSRKFYVEKKVQAKSSFLSSGRGREKKIERGKPRPLL
jgi:hypothetical protein